MKYAAMIEYGTDKDRLKAVHPAHRAHLRTFLENGQLRAAGPFSDDAGPLWVLDCVFRSIAIMESGGSR